MSEKEIQKILESNKNMENKAAQSESTGGAQNSLNVDELKKETTETVKHVKDTLKSVNLKEDTEATKGFVMEFIKNPLSKLQSIVTDPAPFMKTAILLIILWSIASAINSLPTLISFKWNSLLDNIVETVLSFVKGGVAPLLSILVLAGIIFIKDTKKLNSLINIMVTLIIAKIPSIFSELVSILNILDRNVNRITSPVTKLCSVLSVILTYFAVKSLLNKDDHNDFIKEYVIIYGIYCIVGLFSRFFGVYI